MNGDDLTGSYGVVEGDRFAVGIADSELLGTRGDGRSHNGKRIHVYKGCRCGFAADSYRRCGLKTAATNRQGRAAGCGRCGGRDGSNSQRHVGERYHANPRVHRCAVRRGDDEEPLAVFISGEKAAMKTVGGSEELLRE